MQTDPDSNAFSKTLNLFPNSRLYSNKDTLYSLSYPNYSNPFNRLTGLFSFKNFHFMRLTASLGFEAKYLVASAIAVYPANRNTDIAVFRIAALTCGMTPHRTGRHPLQI